MGNSQQVPWRFMYLIHGIPLRAPPIGNGYHSKAQRRSYYNNCYAWGSGTITKHLPTRPMGIKQQDQHTNIWDTNGLIPHQSRVDSQTCPILGQTPTTYLFVFRQTMATTHRKRLDYTATSDTTNITSGHNPGVTSQTLTSGPLTRRRVIIHLEDHTPPLSQ